MGEPPRSLQHPAGPTGRRAGCCCHTRKASGSTPAPPGGKSPWLRLGPAASDAEALVVDGCKLQTFAAQVGKVNGMLHSFFCSFPLASFTKTLTQHPHPPGSPQRSGAPQTSGHAAPAARWMPPRRCRISAGSRVKGRSRRTGAERGIRKTLLHQLMLLGAGAAWTHASTHIQSCRFMARHTLTT